jgi:hypothetical protein
MPEQDAQEEDVWAQEQGLSKQRFGKWIDFPRKALASDVHHNCHADLRILLAKVRFGERQSKLKKGVMRPAL